MKPLLEIAAFNIESAQIAAQAGADRIELCRDLSAGGLTPSSAMILEAKATLSCPFFVMIRPIGGGFVYTPTAIEQMKTELLEAKALGVDGFVFGVLKNEDQIDEAVNKALVTLAHPLPCTFHRAFDDLSNKSEALETVIRCGFQRVLTSGGMGNAIDYCAELQRLVAQAGARIIIMPGGGVRVHNLAQIKSATGASEYHSAAITDGGLLADAHAIQQMQEILAP